MLRAPQGVNNALGLDMAKGSMSSRRKQIPNRTAHRRSGWDTHVLVDVPNHGVDCQPLPVALPLQGVHVLVPSVAGHDAGENVEPNRNACWPVGL